MYADIIKIDTLSSAPAGEQVIVDVSVKNISGDDQYIAVTAVYDSTSFPFQFDYLLVSPGQTVIFRGWFTMPSKNVRVTAWSWSWDGSKWVQDDQMAKDIAMAVLTPQVSEFQILDFSKV
jgi:plastocyanin